MTAGIYAIIDRTGKRYVGKSLFIEKRFDYHRTNLMRGTHHSVALQHAWNSDRPHKINSWKWIILETIPIDEASKVFATRELAYIINSPKGSYNTIGVE